MYKFFIIAQLWFGLHPTVSGYGIPEGTKITGFSGQFPILKTDISYCGDDHSFVWAAEVTGPNSAICRDPRHRLNDCP